MTPDLPDELNRAPKPIRQLARRLSTHEWPLKPITLRDPQRGDRLYYARTPIGTIRVWSRKAAWGAELEPVGMRGFIDHVIWKACQHGEPLDRRPSTAGSDATWLNHLLDGGTLPTYDVQCMTQKSRERGTPPRSAVTTGRLAAAIAIAVVGFALLIWFGTANDQPAVRMAATSGLGVIAAGLISWAATSLRLRRDRRGQRRQQA